MTPGDEIPTDVLPRTVPQDPEARINESEVRDAMEALREEIRRGAPGGRLPHEIESDYRPPRGGILPVDPVGAAETARLNAALGKALERIAALEADVKQLRSEYGESAMIDS